MSDSPFSDLWESIRNDRSRGSRELLDAALEGLSRRLKDDVELSNPKGPLCRKLRDVRPEMTTFASAAALIHEGCEENSIDGLRKAVEWFRTELDRYADQLQSVFDERFEDGDEIVVFSRSGTVLELLRATSRRFQTVHVSEAHPGDEGVTVAEDLREEFPVRFWYDLELPRLLKGDTTVLLGADGMHESGRVLNKCGSRMLAELSGDAEVLVVTETLKVTPKKLDPDDGPTIDSPESLPRNLRRRHPLFEIIPEEELDGYLTNAGVFEEADELTEACAELLEAHRSLEESLDDSK